MITYSPTLLSTLSSATLLPNGSEEEMAIRAASVLAVERVREKMDDGVKVSSVLIDFFLWDLAKVLEGPDGESEEGCGMDVPIHRTRSIW